MVITVSRSRSDQSNDIRVLSEDSLDKNMNFAKSIFKGYNVLK